MEPIEADLETTWPQQLRASLSAHASGIAAYQSERARIDRQAEANVTLRIDRTASDPQLAGWLGHYYHHHHRGRTTAPALTDEHGVLLAVHGRSKLAKSFGIAAEARVPANGETYVFHVQGRTYRPNSR